MANLGIVIRELSCLKILKPIIIELINLGVSFNVYYMDAYKGDKEYNRPNFDRINKIFPEMFKKAKKYASFGNDSRLIDLLLKDKVIKLVALEISLWQRKYINLLKSKKIKLYSISFLSDSLWNDSQSILLLDKIYYSSKYLMEMQLNFTGLQRNDNRDKCLGSPLFDLIKNKPSNGKEILVLTPNIKSEHLEISFGNLKNFINIIEKISSLGNLIFKTRKKQWIPKEIEKLSKIKIEDNLDNLYPSALSNILSQTNITFMFFSSGIYECVLSGNYIINIPLPIERWRWDKNKMHRYFSIEPNNLYQYSGVVESIEQKNFLSAELKSKFNETEWNKWINRYIGNFGNSSKLIAQDLIK